MWPDQLRKSFISTGSSVRSLRTSELETRRFFNMNEEAKGRLIASGAQQRAGDAPTGTKEVAQQVTSYLQPKSKVDILSFFMIHFFSTFLRLRKCFLPSRLLAQWISHIYRLDHKGNSLRALKITRSWARENWHLPIVIYSVLHNFRGRRRRPMAQ